LALDTAFKNIGLMGRLEGESVYETLVQLLDFFQAKNRHVVMEQETAEGFLKHANGDSAAPVKVANARRQAQSIQSCRLQQIGDATDLVVVVGGDGYLLGAGRALAKYDTPLLGVNRGRLGFLTDVSPNFLEDRLEEILEGKYTIEQRFLLDCWVSRNGDPVGSGDALNDVVMHPSHAVQMVEFDLFIEGQFVYTQRSDGLIVATPTGSTAYALSAGGPIMHPNLDAMALVPMFPHALSSRPLVVPGNSEIKIIVKPTRYHQPLRLSCDGQLGIELAEGDVVRIVKKPQKLQLLHPLNYNFYEACRSKLGWSHKFT
jgi:NAD+ kinase